MNAPGGGGAPRQAPRATRFLLFHRDPVDLHGLGADGAQALAEMRARGQRWLSLAAQLGDLEVAAMDAPERAGLTRATRPAPRPPTEQRPTAIAVTQVERLIRNPYETYARKILRLHPLLSIFFTGFLTRMFF